MKLERFLQKKMDDATYLKLKVEHGKELSTAERFRILADVDKVIHGEMKLSEYIKKRGTIYLDDNIQPLFIKEREVKDTNKTEGYLDRRYKLNR